MPPASASEAGSQGCGALCEDTKRLGSVSAGLFWPVMAVLTASWGASTTSLAIWALARRETPHRRCAGHSGQCLAFARCAEHRSRACARRRSLSLPLMAFTHLIAPLRCRGRRTGRAFMWRMLLVMTLRSVLAPAARAVPPAPAFFQALEAGTAIRAGSVPDASRTVVQRVPAVGCTCGPSFPSAKPADLHLLC